MRTTLTIDDDVARRLKEIAHRTGRSFKEVVNRALRAGVDDRGRSPPRKPIGVRTFRMGEPSMINPDKALQFASELENEEIARKIMLRK
jgi:hypothetical protein